MGRFRRYDVRCLECRMRRELCICEHIAACRDSIVTRTRIVVLMHHREVIRTTNTARLAQLALRDVEIRIRGLQDAPMSTEGILDPTRHALLLYPTHDARELNADYFATITKPVTLIVPDGTWGQAVKVAKREAFLKDVPRVKVVSSRASEYGLRRRPKEHGLATFEAIARALGVIEGGLVQERLEALFSIMVTRTLNSRGIRPPSP